MRGLWKLTWTEIKLFLREPYSTFFTLAFPLMLLFLFGSIYGNKPTPFFNGHGSVDVLLPCYAALLIGTSGLISMTIYMAVYRERGVLRRLHATPLRPQTVLGAQVLVIFLMCTLGLALLIAAAKIVYGLRFLGNGFSVLGAYVLSCLGLFSLGFVLASVLPTARTAQAVAMALFYPMMFLSGAAMPREILPLTIRRVARFLPLTHVVDLLRGLWLGDPWSRHLTEVAVLAGLFVVCVAVSLKTFRWE